MNFPSFLMLARDAFEQNDLVFDNFEDRAKIMYEFSLFLMSENNKYNLTSIKTIHEILFRHFVDSMLISKYLPFSSRVIDIGCGAGFPSIPLSVFRPDLSLFPLDSNSKKIAFVKQTAMKFALKNLTPLQMRAESAARTTEFREKFDVAVSRAVGPLPVIGELSIPFVRCGGLFLAMKGPGAVNEFANSHAFFTALGCAAPSIIPYNLKYAPNNEERSLIIADKHEKTADDFPRNYARIIKKPLS